VLARGVGNGVGVGVGLGSDLRRVCARRVTSSLDGTRSVTARLSYGMVMTDPVAIRVQTGSLVHWSVRCTFLNSCDRSHRTWLVPITDSPCYARIFTLSGQRESIDHKPFIHYSQHGVVTGLMQDIHKRIHK
jgi:hypothetical protein